MTVFKIIERQSLNVLMLACSLFLLSAQAPVTREYQIKAGFLFNFTQFVEWPSTSFTSSEAPLIIGILGKNPFGSYLEEIVSGEKVNNHPLIVQYYKSIEERKPCHILFIDPSEAGKPEQVFTSLKGSNTLTVSDASGFLKQGGMVRFFTEENKIRLQINLEESKTADLVISSKLLRLAEIFVPDKK